MRNVTANVGVLLGLALPGLAAAAMLPIEPGVTEPQAFAWATRILQPTADAPMHFTPLTEPDMTAGTELRILYRSPVAVPVEAGLIGGRRSDMVRTVLPPSGAGDVRIPLSSSASWRQGATGIELLVYWKEGSEPEILGMGSEGKLGIGERLGAYAGHLLRGEPLGATSVMYLDGYRIAGLRVHVIVAVLAIVAAGAAVAVGKKRAAKMCSGIFFGAMIVVSAQASIDRAAQTAQEISVWQSERRIGDMGYVFAAADVLKSERRGDPLTIVACTQLVAPLKYAVFPDAVTRDAAQLPAATHALVQGVWSDDATIFSCDGVERAGRLLRRFPSGEAVVSFRAP